MTAVDESTAADRQRPTNSAITMVTPLTWWGAPWLRLQFRLTRRFPQLKGLEPFASVYFSRWSIVSGFPDNGPPQIKERPRRPYLVWEVVYSAETGPYIESFLKGIQLQIRRTWGSSDGFPGVSSVSELRRYIEDLSWAGAYDYWAYPETSVRMVLSALAVSREHAFLATVARSSTAEEFETVYRGFLRRRGKDL